VQFQCCFDETWVRLPGEYVSSNASRRDALEIRWEFTVTENLLATALRKLNDLLFDRVPARRLDDRPIGRASMAG